MSAQIARLLDLGLNPSHIDSHHQVHALPALFPVLKLLQRKYKIKAVRLGQNIHPQAVPRAKRVKVALFNWALRNLYRTKTTDGFTSFDTFFLRARQGRLPFKTVELMLHPGAKGYVQETADCCGDWRLAVPFEIELISYHHL